MKEFYQFVEVEKPNLLIVALHNLSKREGSSKEYCRGLVVGILSTFMSLGMDYRQAVKIIHKYLPPDFRKKGIPESIRGDILALDPAGIQGFIVSHSTEELNVALQEVSECVQEETEGGQEGEAKQAST